MGLYARSDNTSVIFSVASGGCGQVHSRPVKNGAPVRDWLLDCPKCCALLVGDPLWASTKSEIPETPDEQHVREDRDKRGAKDQAEATGVALEELAKMPGILEALTALVAGQKVSVAAVVPCRDCGVDVAGGQRFCTECGARDPAEAGLVPDAPSQAFAVDSYTVADVPLPDEPGETAPDRVAPHLDSMTWTQLKAHAAELGMATSGSRDVLLKRLSKRAEFERRSAAA